MRKLIQAVLSPKEIKRYQALEELETEAFCMKLLNDPKNFREHIRRSISSYQDIMNTEPSTRTIASQILQLSYGHNPKEGDDELLRVVEIAMDDFSRATLPGSFLVDFMPFCQHVSLMTVNNASDLIS